MPFRLTPPFGTALTDADRALVGMWVCSGSPLVAEICAGSGLDWLLIDAEHSPNDLTTLLAQLQATQGYPITAMVRPPSADPVVLKQFLDLGAQNLLVPMIDDGEQAREVARAVTYPPEGIRGVGSALARGSRWNRAPDYLHRARQTISVYLQVESADAVRNVEEIAATPGIDGIFVGPSDLAASMGLLGEQGHPDVVDAVLRCIAAAKHARTKVGVNAFAPPLAQRYADAGADFILVGADVDLLARGSERLASAYLKEDKS
ncbi:HpcH/HpaI aldolase/citrate lyase family protein [Streptomyces sp. NPDC059894]|uniref:HpcH/HpaI aldolase family protein n=1 Tax=unclassified Streptomyces TaxID=2593676 RepID=UPI00364A304B